MTQTIQALLQAARQELRDRVDDAYTDSQVLMGACLQRERAWLMAHADEVIGPDQADHFWQLVEQRKLGIPVAYLSGRREFWSMDFHVSPATLIPRPETEHLVEQVLALPVADDRVNVLDFGSGSGIIAIALAKERPAWQITGMDCSRDALQVARDNASMNQVDVAWLHACNLDSFKADQFDVLVSNPPYVPSNDPHLQQGDVRFEPVAALASGTDGLDCIRYLVKAAPLCLKPAGYLALEHGYDQADVVRKLLLEQGYQNIASHRDLAGHERLTVAQWRA